MKHHRISIRIRIVILNFGLLALFALFFYGFFLPHIEQRLMERKQEVVKEAVRLGSSILLSLHKAEQDGRLSREEAQQEAIERIRELRYEKDGRNYLWINDFKPVMIMHPYATQLNGKSLTDYKDPDGKHLFMEMVDVSKRDGAGFVNYRWQYFDEKDNIVPKVSYVETFTPWGWILGSGIYVNDVQAEINELKTVITLGFIAVAVISSIAVFFFSSRIVRPIQQLRIASRLVAGGDLRSPVAVDSSDEMLDLATDFNQLIESMRDVLGVIVRHSTELAASTEEMSATLNTFTSQAQNQSASTEQIAATTEELSAGMDNVKKSTEHQTASVLSLIQTVRGLSDSIDGMARLIAQAQQETGQITGLAREGEDSLRHLNESMNNVLQSSSSVTGIVQIINEISDRINLLSLNAAIEAARAGDSGRGFAVVAEEVGKLAERTSSSIRDISQLVEVNNQQLKEGIGQLQSTTRFITEILTGIGRMNERMTDLKGTMTDQTRENEAVQTQLENVSNRSDEIKHAIGEQKNAVSEIAQSVSSINDAIQSVVSAAEQMTATSEQIAAMAESMREKATFFKV